MFEASIRLQNPMGSDTFDDLPGAVKHAITAALAAATSTPDQVVSCVWEGYGYPWGGSPSSLAFYTPPGVDPGPWPWPVLPAAIRNGPTAAMPGHDRGFVVLRGPAASMHRIGWTITDGWYDSRWPDIAYPHDRAWLSFSDIDDDTIDIHGTRQLIERLRGIDGLTTTTRDT